MTVRDGSEWPTWSAAISDIQKFWAPILFLKTRQLRSKNKSQLGDLKRSDVSSRLFFFVFVIAHPASQVPIEDDALMRDIFSSFSYECRHAKSTSTQISSKSVRATSRSTVCCRYAASLKVLKSGVEKRVEKGGKTSSDTTPPRTRCSTSHHHAIRIRTLSRTHLTTQGSSLGSSKEGGITTRSQLRVCWTKLDLRFVSLPSMSGL